MFWCATVCVMLYRLRFWCAGLNVVVCSVRDLLCEMFYESACVCCCVLCVIV